MSAATCWSCGAGIVWARTPKGHRVPLDAATCQPWTDGALVVVTSGTDLWAYSGAVLVPKLAQARRVSEQQATHILAADHAWHLSHFATCLNAAAHRRRR